MNIETLNPQKVYDNKYFKPQNMGGINSKNSVVVFFLPKDDVWRYGQYISDIDEWHIIPSSIDKKFNDSEILYWFHIPEMKDIIDRYDEKYGKTVVQQQL